MPKRMSLETIHARIAELQKKAIEIENLSRPRLYQVIKLVKKHKLTADDLKSVFSSRQRKSSPLEGKKAPVKYCDDRGNKWSGRGLKPKWIRAAEKAGHKIDEFLIKRHDADLKPSASRV